MENRHHRLVVPVLWSFLQRKKVHEIVLEGVKRFACVKCRTDSGRGKILPPGPKDNFEEDLKK